MDTFKANTNIVSPSASYCEQCGPKLGPQAHFWPKYV